MSCTSETAVLDMQLPILRIDGDAHRSIQLCSDDVIEDLPLHQSCHGDPVIQGISPVDTSRQPVDGHAVNLSRYTRINYEHRYVVCKGHVRRFLLITNTQIAQLISVILKRADEAYRVQGGSRKVRCILWWIFQQSRTIFQKFFHCYTQQEICNKEIIIDVTTSKKCQYTTCKILIFKNCIDRKHSNGRPGVRILKRM